MEEKQTEMKEKNICARYRFYVEAPAVCQGYHCTVLLLAA